jgi:electron transfer flavoprotein alpha subunit
MAATSILVFIERRGNEVKRSSLEAVRVARQMADAMSSDVHAVALGEGATTAAETIAPHGADQLHVCEASELNLYQARAYAACLAHCANATGARILIAPASAMGRDVAARCAAKLDAAFASDVVELSADADGTVHAKRPVYSGKAIATVRVSSNHPVVASIRPNVFTLGAADDARSATVDSFELPLDAGTLTSKTTRVELPEQKEIDVAEAGIVVSGGRGLKEADNFAVIKELADALGGAVGASRAVVDLDWIGHGHQVGQTGKVVSPALYIACGISGAIQHLAGMSSSKTIVAINKDPEAPIFKVADYGIVGDLFEIVPALTAAVKAHQA